MKGFRFKKIDAFAAKSSSGNPAGYVLLDPSSDISESEMQEIARELKGFVNETGFVRKTEGNRFVMKYYSSEREVDFCGHATIAIMYDIFKTDPLLSVTESVNIRTNRGILNVENRIKEEDAVFIMSPEPVYHDSVPDLEQISEALKINSDGISSSFPVSVINAGLTTLLVPVLSLEVILGILPHQSELERFCINSDIDIVEVFTDDVAYALSSYRTRVFARNSDILKIRQQDRAIPRWDIIL